MCPKLGSWSVSAEDNEGQLNVVVDFDETVVHRPPRSLRGQKFS